MRVGNAPALDAVAGLGDADAAVLGEAAVLGDIECVHAASAGPSRYAITARRMIS